MSRRPRSHRASAVVPVSMSSLLAAPVRAFGRALAGSAKSVSSASARDSLGVAAFDADEALVASGFIGGAACLLVELLGLALAGSCRRLVPIRLPWSAGRVRLCLPDCGCWLAGPADRFGSYSGRRDFPCSILFASPHARDGKNSLSVKAFRARCDESNGLKRNENYEPKPWRGSANSTNYVHGTDATSRMRRTKKAAGLVARRPVSFASRGLRPCRLRRLPGSFVASSFARRLLRRRFGRSCFVGFGSTASTPGSALGSNSSVKPASSRSNICAMTSMPWA